eukprot:c19433_g1_i1 orf=37-1848(-)
MPALDESIVSNSCGRWFICGGGAFNSKICWKGDTTTLSSVPPVVDPPKLKRGGWRSIPYILMNELAERLAGVGLSLNLISYLMGSYHMNQVMAASVLNTVSGTASLTPLVGAFLSDAYVGRFWMIVLGSVSHLIASLLLIVTAACPSLRPPPGSAGASRGDLAFLFGALAITTITAGALRPCNYAFGTDQLTQQGTPEEDKKQTQTFFNWYFFFLYCATLAGATVLVYIQDEVGWVWGFSLPAAFVVIAIVLLILGSPRFHYVPPIGSPFTVFARVLVAALRKWKHPLPYEDRNLNHGKGASLDQDGIDEDLPHTKHLKWLDHAAIVTKSDLNPDGSINSCRSFWLCTVNEVEQLKAVVALAPLWMVNMLSTTVLSQHGVFNVPQARRMDRNIGSSSFTIPPASMSVFSSITLLLWMPFYDRVVVPKARKMTGHPDGIKTLQRIGIGFCLSIVALIVSGVVEMRRRRLGQHNVRMSAFWLVPQQCLYGLGDSFHAVGQLEFLYDQLPFNMRSVAGAVFWCSAGFGHYAGTLILQLVHRYSTAAGADWLADDMDHGHLDYFFFLLAILQSVNVFLFFAMSRHYKYKGSAHASTHISHLSPSANP